MSTISAPSPSRPGPRRAHAVETGTGFVEQVVADHTAPSGTFRAAPSSRNTDDARDLLGLRRPTWKTRPREASRWAHRASRRQVIAASTSSPRGSKRSSSPEPTADGIGRVDEAAQHSFAAHPWAASGSSGASCSSTSSVTNASGRPGRPRSTPRRRVARSFRSIDCHRACSLIAFQRQRPIVKACWSIPRHLGLQLRRPVGRRRAAERDRLRRLRGADRRGLVFSVVNIFVRPLMILFTLPLVILTLGLALFFINLFMLYLTSWIVDDFTIDSFWWAFLATIIVWLVNTDPRGVLRGRPARSPGAAPSPTWSTAATSDSAPVSGLVAGLDALGPVEGELVAGMALLGITGASTKATWSPDVRALQTFPDEAVQAAIEQRHAARAAATRSARTCRRRPRSALRTAPRGPRHPPGGSAPRAARPSRATR